MQCLLIWQSSWHLLCNIHCIIIKYIVHKVIYARVQWAVLVYKGSCREGEAVSCSVSRSRGGAERHWRAHNSAQCNSATVQSAGLTTSLPSCFRPDSWEHRTTFCSPQAVAVNIHSASCAASSLVGWCLCCNLCLLVSSLSRLEFEVPLELCVRLNSAARLGSAQFKVR